jgi:hypothetical protein
MCSMIVDPTQLSTNDCSRSRDISICYWTCLQLEELVVEMRFKVVANHPA